MPVIEAYYKQRHSASHNVTDKVSEEYGKQIAAFDIVRKKIEKSADAEQAKQVTELNKIWNQQKNYLYEIEEALGCK
ncbi:MAG: hypothetical protein Q8P11_01885 [bacterium]|nr:hypothetical protein [bacterium]